MSGNETPLVCSCDIGYLGTGAWDRVAQSYQTCAPRVCGPTAQRATSGTDQTPGCACDSDYVHKPGVADNYVDFVRSPMACRACGNAPPPDRADGMDLVSGACPGWCDTENQVCYHSRCRYGTPGSTCAPHTAAPTLQMMAGYGQALEYAGSCGHAHALRSLAPMVSAEDMATLAPAQDRRVCLRGVARAPRAPAAATSTAMACQLMGEVPAALAAPAAAGAAWEGTQEPWERTR